MAIQFATAIPWIAATIGAFFLQLIEFLARFMTRKAALSVAAIGLVLTITLTFVGGLIALLLAVKVSIPPEFSGNLGMVLPYNFIPCSAAILTSKFLAYIYRWQAMTILYKFNV